MTGEQKAEDPADGEVGRVFGSGWSGQDGAQGEPGDGVASVEAAVFGTHHAGVVARIAVVGSVAMADAAGAERCVAPAAGVGKPARDAGTVFPAEAERSAKPRAVVDER